MYIYVDFPLFSLVRSTFLKRSINSYTHQRKAPPKSSYITDGSINSLGFVIGKKEGLRMERSVDAAACCKEVLLGVETECSSGSTTRKPRVSFHEVLDHVVHRERSGTKDPFRHSSWQSAWDRAKFRLMHPPEEHGPFSDDDVIENFPMETNMIKLDKCSLLRVAVLVLIILSLVCTVSIPGLKWRTMCDLSLWKWEILLLALISGRLISGCAVWLVAIFIESHFPLRKRVLYFIYGLKRDVQNCVWLGLVLLIWCLTFDGKFAKTETRVLPYVTKILVCLLVASAIWLFKTLMVKLLASSFHVKTYFERIDDAIFNLRVIEILSGKPLRERGVRSDAARDQLKVSLVRKRSPSTRRNHAASAWHVMKAIEIIRRGSLVTLDDKIPDANTDADDESTQEDRCEHEARAVAAKIFHNVAKPGAESIYLDDLRCFFNTEDEAAKVLCIFGVTTEQDGVDKKSLRNWVMKALKERNSLAQSLNDTNTAVDDLHNMLNVVTATVIAIIWLIVLGVPITQFLVVISSQLLLAAFVFGNSCKTVFEAIVFLFVMHPYDIDDLCEVDGVQMTVQEMNILTTVFVRHSDNLKIRYPNSILSTKPISNYNRSAPMIESIEFCIHISTPMDKVRRLNEIIKEFVERRSDHWQPAPKILIKDLEDMNKIVIVIWVRHKIRHHDIGERWSRRAVLIERMIDAFKMLEIEYRMLPLDVNVRNLPCPTGTARLPSNWTSFA